MRKSAGLLALFWPLMMVAQGLAADSEAARPAEIFPAANCAKPQPPPHDPGDRFNTVMVDNYNQRIRKYNQQTRDFNTCLRDYVGKANDELKRIQDTANAELHRVQDNANNAIKDVQQKIRDATAAANP